uniref:Uncharacterized protein n=1 Tax=Panagrolaimus sp. PS1159 TaxID=55785 RepID=A0AC35GUV1_9BILA
MYEHCNLHDCEFNNTCLIDSFLTASLLYDKQNENCLSKTIKTYESKNVAENAFLHLLVTDKSFSKRSKHIFLKKLFKDQRNLFGDEENIVLKHFKHRYLIYGNYECQSCHFKGTTEPEDCMFFQRVLNSVEETIIKSMQPENMSIVKVCCNKTVEVLNKRFVDDIPWILPLRPLDFTILRDFTPNMIELIPLTVEVVNSGETITYKLGLISFALIGHFIGLIPSKEGWILFDSFKDPILLHLRDAIQRVTAQGGLINTLYYYVSIE